MKKQNLIFMHGEDRFSLRAELARWKKAFLERPGGDMNFEEISGDFSGVNTSVLALPFLAEKRLVILKGFMEKQSSDEQRELIPTLKKLPDSTVLVLAEEKPDKRTSLYKFLVQNATVKLFEKPKGPALHRWIMSRAVKHQGGISQSSASYLANLIGDDLYRLDNEIQKLCLFAGSAEISVAMIDELVMSSIEKGVFEMTDQLARRNIKGALSILKSLHEQGHEAPYLFAMIARQFRLMLEMKALSEQRLAPNVIASKMKVHPFVVKTTLGQCRNFTYGQLKWGLESLLELDRRLKSGRLHFRSNEADQYMLALERVLMGKRES